MVWVIQAGRTSQLMGLQFNLLGPFELQCQVGLGGLDELSTTSTSTLANLSSYIRETIPIEKVAKDSKT